MTQEQLESILFAIMEEKGFGGEYVKRYKMVTNFFRQRRPLIILICGVHCSGKSSSSHFSCCNYNRVDW